jgi:hypothetical protein
MNDSDLIVASNGTCMSRGLDDKSLRMIVLFIDVGDNLWILVIEEVDCSPIFEGLLLELFKTSFDEFQIRVGLSVQETERDFSTFLGHHHIEVLWN